MTSKGMDLRFRFIHPSIFGNDFGQGIWMVSTNFAKWILIMLLCWCQYNCGFEPWILILTRLKHIFTNQNLAIITFLTMRNKFVLLEVKKSVLQDSRNSWKAFPVSYWLCKNCLYRKLSWGLKKWQEVKWIWQVRQNFLTQFIQLLKQWFCGVQSSMVVQRDQTLSVDQCWLQAMQFSVHLINLLSILLRHNGFARIQKAVVDQTNSRPPNSDHDLGWCKFGLGKCFGGSSLSSHWACHLQLSYKIHISS